MFWRQKENRTEPHHFFCCCHFFKFPRHTLESIAHLLTDPLSSSIVCVSWLLFEPMNRLKQFISLLHAPDFSKMNLLQSPTHYWSRTWVPKRHDRSKITQQWSGKASPCRPRAFHHTTLKYLKLISKLPVLCPSSICRSLITSKKQHSQYYYLYHHFLKCTRAAHFKARAKDNP